MRTIIPDKVKKILFYLTFLPYLAILVSGIYCALFGATFIYNRVYGWDGFVLGVIIMAYRLCSVLILPISVLYHVYVLISKKILKGRAIPKRVIAIIMLTIGMSVCGWLLWENYGFQIGQMIEKHKAYDMISRADDVLTYDRGNFYTSGIFDTQYQSSTVFLDSKTMELGFLMYHDYEEYFSVKLKPADEKILRHIYNDYYVQAELPMNRGRLLAFYTEKDMIHRTIAFVLETKEEVYLADEVREPDTGFIRFTGLQWSQYFPGENVKYHELKEDTVWKYQKNKTRL